MTRDWVAVAALAAAAISAVVRWWGWRQWRSRVSDRLDEIVQHLSKENDDAE